MYCQVLKEPCLVKKRLHQDVWWVHCEIQNLLQFYSFSNLAGFHEVGMTLLYDLFGHLVARLH